MSTWKTELIDIVEGRITPTYTDELILQTAPTRTLIGTGCRLEHGIVAGNDADGWTKKLMRIGVADHGWAYVEPGISGSSPKNVGDALGEGDLERVSWLMNVQDASYFPVKEWEMLPPALHLSQYDIGQPVVFTHAEVMGRTGSIVGMHQLVAPSGPGELTVRVQVKGSSPIDVKQEAVAALVLDGDYEGTVSVGRRYPAGSKVWVKQHVRAGQPFAWRPAVSTGWTAGQLEVTFLDDGSQGLVLRNLLAPGDEPAPQAIELAPRVDGRNPVPKGKRARKWNVPKA